MTTTTQNSPTTPHGRTRLRYDANGALVEQSLDPSTYQNRGAVTENISRPQPPTPKTAEQLTGELERNTVGLDAALSHFEKWQHKDEHGEERRSLRMFLAEFEQRVKEARERLTELEAADSPHTKLLKAVAAIEMQTSHLAREAQLSAAERVAVSQYDQAFNKITREHQREIYRRNAIARLQYVASNSFHGFGRLELAQSTLDGAKMCTDKIKNAFTAIAETIEKACE